MNNSQFMENPLWDDISLQQNLYILCILLKRLTVFKLRLKNLLFLLCKNKYINAKKGIKGWGQRWLSKITSWYQTAVIQIASD